MDRSILSRPGPAPDSTMRYGDDTDQVVDVWYGDTEKPVVVLIHGGFWRARYDRLHVRPMATAIRERGWPVAALEYRRIGGQPEASTDDVRRALDTATARVDGNGAVIMGHSAGGQLALWAAAVCPPAGLLNTIALAPVADLVHAHEAKLGDGAVAAFLGEPPNRRPDLDPARMAAPASRVVLIHGESDTSVPVQISESYQRAHPEAELVVIPAIGHFELIDPDSVAWPIVVHALPLQPGDSVSA
ncbi:acetyl esterase/lipase [Tamaricihabitans halophyticus]|uniref:Acetyl esterase/lipase n=2 Tax=Tamaricihabitans halophyticus TaxID=1262583 RepID=A0A4R2QFJ8_9PSEU|nr:acetyl esterase/lipase [Tamaricihabitans halophyticus]